MIMLRFLLQRLIDENTALVHLKFALPYRVVKVQSFRKVIDIDTNTIIICPQLCCNTRYFNTGNKIQQVPPLRHLLYFFVSVLSELSRFMCINYNLVRS